MKYFLLQKDLRCSATCACVVVWTVCSVLTKRAPLSKLCLSNHNKTIKNEWGTQNTKKSLKHCKQQIFRIKIALTDEVHLWLCQANMCALAVNEKRVVEVSECQIGQQIILHADNLGLHVQVSGGFSLYFLTPRGFLQKRPFYWRSVFY